jgi:hypothetical protein
MTNAISRVEATGTYPEPTFPARYDLEAWCWHNRHATGETGEAARFVLGDMARGCWPETRSLEPFHHAHHGRGAVGRGNIFIEHLVGDHGAGLDSPLVRMVVAAHQMYLRDMREFWKRAERILGPAPALDAVLDFSGR